MDDMEPFAEERWRGDLAEVIERHELDQLSGIDADLLADFLGDVAGRLVGLVKLRDRGMPEALGALERAELAALRRSMKLQEEIVNNLHVRLGREQDKVKDLEIRLKAAQGAMEVVEKRLALG